MTATSTHPKLGRLSLAIDGPVARIALRNPPLNVIDIAMIEELSICLAEIETREDVWVVALSGEGRAFSVGVDVAAHTPDQVEGMLQKFHAVIRALVATKARQLECVTSTGLRDALRASSVVRSLQCEISTAIPTVFIRSTICAP